jgi:hypothetical protein
MEIVIFVSFIGIIISMLLLIFTRGSNSNKSATLRSIKIPPTPENTQVIDSPTPENTQVVDSPTPENTQVVDSPTPENTLSEYDILNAEMHMTPPPNPDPVQAQTHNKYSKYIENTILYDSAINTPLNVISDRVLNIDEYDKKSDNSVNISDIVKNKDVLSYTANGKAKSTVKYITKYRIATKLDGDKLHIIMRLYTNYAMPFKSMGKRIIISYIYITITQNGAKIEYIISNMITIVGDYFIPVIEGFITNKLKTIFTQIIN